MTISQPKSNEDEISLCVKAAIEKLDRVEEDANKKKTQIVQDLAKDLEGKIATDSICNEIVHQLRGKVSETLIRRCLDEKYKEKHRVANARKQKKKHESTDDLVAQVPLNNGDTNQQEEKKVVIDTAGNEIVEQEDANTKEESMLRDSFDDNNSRPKKDLTATKKEVLVSHVPMTFEDLRKDRATVFQTTKGIGNVFFRVWVDLGIGEAKIEFCGITEHNTMTSAGKGKLKEADTNFPLGI